MAKQAEFGRLSDEAAADVSARAGRFRAAWQSDGTTSLEWFLPPAGSSHRAAVLAQLILADMDLRAQVGLPFDVESYIAAYPEDLSAAAVPVAVLAAEYRLRHHHGDRPPAEEYRRRFPSRYEEFARHIAEKTAPGPHLSATDPESDRPSRSSADDTIIRDPSAAPSGLLVTGPTASAERRIGEGSTILPASMPYQLLRKLGNGAFGEVFEALAPGGVRVAVKRISRGVDHPASKSEREALDAIKELSHPFLLKTNAYWVFDDRLVIVMELADGSLADRIEHHASQGRAGVPPEELLPLFEQAAEALDYLHSQNVSHRDVKPENILLLKGYAKVGDFGLARIQDHTMTVVNSTVGTPAYMAPEMWRQRVSLQSDQYSLAATYVRARLNRHLFQTNVLVDMANFHIHETPNLDQLPEAERKVLLKALAKDPDDRYRNCAEFARELRAAALPAPGPATPAQPRRAALVGAALLAALACAAVAVAVSWSARGPVEPPPDRHAEKKEQERPKEPPQPVVIVQQPDKKFAVYPSGWRASAKGGEVLLIDRYYHKALTRKIGDRELTARLVYWDSATRPDPFYVFEDKVTNAVLDHAWRLASLEPAVRSLLAGHPDWAPGKWRSDPEGKPLAVDGADGDLPALGATVPEALIAAKWLGGSLPTFRQWQKAAGVLEDEATQGPAGPPLMPPKPLDRDPLELTDTQRGELANWKEKQFSLRKLALGLKRPLPVGDPRASGDISRPWGIRQLVTNGQEWLGEGGIPPAAIALFPAPIGEQQAFYVGHAPQESEIDPLSRLQTLSPGSLPWLTVDGHYAGFRVVLEPR